MINNILTLKNFDGKLELELYKTGDLYCVCLSNSELNDYPNKIFKSIDEALLIFTKLVEVIAKDSSNYEEIKELLQ